MIINSPPSLNGPSAHSEKIQADALLAKYLDVQRGHPACKSRASAARHFLHWLRLHRFSLSQVNFTAVERFKRHRCQCPSYSPREPHRPGYTPMFVGSSAFLKITALFPFPKTLVKWSLYCRPTAIT